MIKHWMWVPRSYTGRASLGALKVAFDPIGIRSPQCLVILHEMCVRLFRCFAEGNSPSMSTLV